MFVHVCLVWPIWSAWPVRPLTCLSLLHPLSGLCVCPCGAVLYCVSTVLQTAAGEARLRDPEYASCVLCVVCAQREHKGSIQLVGA